MESSPDLLHSNEIENPRNCVEPSEDPRSLVLDLYSDDCTPIKTLNQTVDSHKTEATPELTSPMDGLNVSDQDQSYPNQLNPFTECSEQIVTAERSDYCEPLIDPYDNDNASVYGVNEELPDWRQVNRPCVQAGCFYRPNKKIADDDINNQLGPALMHSKRFGNVLNVVA